MIVRAVAVTNSGGSGIGPGGIPQDVYLSYYRPYQMVYRVGGPPVNAVCECEVDAAVHVVWLVVIEDMDLLKANSEMRT